MAYKRITVTPDDIGKAIRSDSMHCVVSQAIARTLPKVHHIDTDNATIRFTDERGDRWAYLTPPAVQGYVVAFDAGDTIEPFSFVLNTTQRVKLKARRATPEGLEAQRAASAARREARKAAGHPMKKKKGEDQPDTPEIRAAAKAAYKAAAGSARTVANPKKGRRTEPPSAEQITKGEVEVTAMPRTFRTKKRTYGHRVMRVNQGA